MADTGGILVPAPPPPPELLSLQGQIADLQANEVILQEAVTVAWMFLNACLIFLMQVRAGLLSGLFQCSLRADLALAGNIHPLT